MAYTRECPCCLELAREEKQKPVNDDLAVAVTEQMEYDGDVDDFVRRGIDDIALKYAALGAQWQKEQMLKDAIETTIDGKVVKVIVIDE